MNFNLSLFLEAGKSKSSSIVIYRYEQCVLRYDQTNFFSIMQTGGIYWCNPYNVTDQQQFNMVLGNFFNTLSSNAANSSQMFAFGHVNYTDPPDLYGHAECTRDLSKEDCYSCLQYAVARILILCAPSQGGSYYGSSCRVRYEIFPFYNVSAVPNAAAPPPPPFPAAPPPTPTAVLPPTPTVAPPPSSHTNYGKSISQQLMLHI
jgi:Salt stress response/antifungal